jgi:bud emergence protein 1
MDEYWFRIDAIYQPYPESESSSPPPAKQLILFRVYNDFYDFQVSLLDTFPREGGRHPPHPRILPFMPGPAESVDDILTATRRLELDAYIHDLCQLANNGARYILEHQVVREFLSLKPGDVEQPLEQAFDSEPSTIQGNNPVVHSAYDRELAQKMGGLRADDEKSEGSDYGEDRYNPSTLATSDIERFPYAWKDRRPPIEADTQMLADGQSHERSSSSTSFHSRSYSPHPERTFPSQAARNGHHAHTPSRHEASYQPSSSTTQHAASHHSSQKSSRSRSQSNATSNLNNPPISAANPQTAFVKIKIFDRTNDLIAIRVHPKVTHSELMGKVQGRLGGEVSILRYRDSLTNTFVGLDNDDDLRVWMEGTGKHVLYAD